MKILLQTKVSTSGLQRATLILGLISGFPLGYLLVNGVLMGMGDRGFLPDYIGLMIALSVVLVGISLYVHYVLPSDLTIMKNAQDKIEIHIKHKSGAEHFASGTWTCEAKYIKEYAKYGMYRKNLFLSLYCDNKPFCVFRHMNSAVQSAPSGFTEAHDVYTPVVENYFTKKTDEIYAILSGRNSP